MKTNPSNLVFFSIMENFRNISIFVGEIRFSNAISKFEAIIALPSIIELFNFVSDTSERLFSVFEISKNWPLDLNELNLSIDYFTCSIAHLCSMSA